MRKIRVELYSVPLNNLEMENLMEWKKDPYFAVRFADESNSKTDFVYIHYDRAEYKYFDERTDKILDSIQWNCFNVNVYSFQLYDKAVHEAKKFLRSVGLSHNFKHPDYRCLPFKYEERLITYYNLRRWQDESI